MSYDVSLYIDVDTGGPEPHRYYPADIGNYTSNVSGMWTKALGYRLADLNERTAGDCTADLQRAVSNMETNRAEYEAMNPPNGWGDYAGALEYLRELYYACLASPKARIRISH